VILAAGEGPVEPNPYILPYDINEAIWGSLATIIVVSLIVWKAGPAIKGAWNGRIERIEGELASAEAARRDGEASLGEVQDRIANAETERQRILAEARDTAAALQSQLVAKATQDAEDLKVRAAADIESSKSQVLADLRAEVATLALGAAEAVVASNLDPATQTELIESYITKVGTPS
jgi:F-type H+-transporting ATPase subunit b